MKSQNIIRRKSLSIPRAKQPSDNNSQFLKPMKPQLLHIHRSPQNNRTMKKPNTLFLDPSNLSRSMNKFEIKDSNSCGIPSKSPESGHEQEVQKSYSKSCQKLINKLENKLKEIPKNDFKAVFSTYFGILDSVILHDLEFSGVLKLVKNGLICSFNNYYKSKVSKYNNEITKLKNILEKISEEKESFIKKLNFLSSQNINLIISNEDIVERYKKIKDSLEGNASTNKKRPSLIDELNQKNEKIKELSEKLEEMHTHENKLLQIIEKINVNGLDVEKLYHHTAARKILFEKKRKNPVPSINLTFLEDTSPPAAH